MHAKPPFNISRTRVCVLINISSMAEMKNVRYNMINVSLTKTSTSKSCMRIMMKYVFLVIHVHLLNFGQNIKQKLHYGNLLFFFWSYTLHVHVTCFNFLFQKKPISPHYKSLHWGLLQVDIQTEKSVIFLLHVVTWHRYMYV